MSPFREALLDEMITMFGFEHPFVIQFAQSCLAYTELPTASRWDKILEDLVSLYRDDVFFEGDSNA